MDRIRPGAGFLNRRKQIVAALLSVAFQFPDLIRIAGEPEDIRKSMDKAQGFTDGSDGWKSN